ncbi:hypothetical protein M430DRAFT_248221 [Amorphotheca resinae ATCC 22711]|uniref:DUF202 domain-containing protein n=1 Tax=Amorphotheca resinae ATCC 22711 TaxID=857342 RepID=A0A2T3B036_AMORE|nr:hypothetical protein M430DRAFT_248221 [Amorphotheca resinae ATCC 22711]PSS16777.1 hypothetical protein M430DRAFT_248221 [Amorphotheca resinae ATCC 22711]
MPPPGDEEDARPKNTYRPLGIPLHAFPVNVAEHHGKSVFCVPPLFGPLLFDNTDSDARDHCANERTFLSYLRLSIYMTIVSIAIVISFHLKSQPSRLELRMARPLGVVFWLLSLACLALGFGNYIKTVNKYSRRAAIVQTGWKTQSVLSIIALFIIAVCVLFLATNSKRY